MDELKGHEEGVNSLISEGEELMSEQHFAASEISDRLQKLRDTWSSLNLQALQRTSNLNDSLKLQQVSNFIYYLWRYQYNCIAGFIDE